MNVTNGSLFSSAVVKSRAHVLLFTKSLVVAVFFIFVAALLRVWPLHILGNTVPWITFYPAVMAVALYAGGFWGVFSTLLTLLVVGFFWPLIAPTPFIRGFADVLGAGVFLFTCTMISFIAESMRKSKKKAVEAQKRAQFANEAKSAFLANMSHELRTPLNAILGYSRLMQQDYSLSAENKRYLSTINTSGEHLLALINDILEITKIESRKAELHVETFNCVEMIQDLFRMFKQKADAKKISLIVTGIEQLPPYLVGDVLKLRVVLINLIGNALKFTASGQIALRIDSLWLSATEVRLRFEVSDTGSGIDAADMDKLFKFFSQTKSGELSTAGTGLGLAISQNYVHLMGGVIEVTSTVGTGSSFFFSITMQVAPKLDAKMVDRIESVRLVDFDRAHRILVVDDIEDNRDLLVELLRKARFDVRSANDGAEAVAQFIQYKPEFIWMDIRMPVMDGLEATKRIRALPDAKQPVIIALSAHVFEEERDSIIAAGCDDFLAKPFKNREIFDLLAKYLEVKFEHIDQPFASGVEIDEAALALAMGKIDRGKRESLRNALVLLDEDAIMTELGFVANSIPGEIDALKTLALRMDYTKLLRIVDGGENHAGK